MADVQAKTPEMRRRIYLSSHLESNGRFRSLAEHFEIMACDLQCEFPFEFLGLMAYSSGGEERDACTVKILLAQQLGRHNGYQPCPGHSNLRERRTHDMSIMTGYARYLHSQARQIFGTLPDTRIFTVFPAPCKQDIEEMTSHLRQHWTHIDPFKAQVLARALALNLLEELAVNCAELPYPENVFYSSPRHDQQLNIIGWQNKWLIELGTAIANARRNARLIKSDVNIADRLAVVQDRIGTDSLAYIDGRYRKSFTDWEKARKKAEFQKRAEKD
ncbi:MAG: hypothetical protein V1659_03995 [Candidatus Woesearchaeota archaeon]